MARWKTQANFSEIPAGVRVYDPALHGPGDEGVRRWKDQAFAWLGYNPGQELPCGNVIGVLREAIRLMGGTVARD